MALAGAGQTTKLELEEESKRHKPKGDVTVGCLWWKCAN